MALPAGKHVINIGAFPNDSTGDTIRDGGEKINHMFNEIYSALGDGSTISFVGSSTLAQIIDVSSNLASYVANTDMLMGQMANVYATIGDGTNLLFNVHTYLTDTNVFENKDISAANNKITISIDDLSDVNVTGVTTERVLTYDPINTEWIAKEHEVNGTVTSSLIPYMDDVYDLGSLTKRFKNLHLSNTIHLGAQTIEVNANGEIEFSAPIAAASITSQTVITEVLTQNTEAIYVSAIGGYDSSTTFDNTTGVWLPFPFDVIESENPPNNDDGFYITKGFDFRNFEYNVQANGVYRVVLSMVSPATFPNAQFRLVSSKPPHGNPDITEHFQDWIFLNDSERTREYFIPCTVGDRIWCEYTNRFYQRSQISISRV